MLAADADLELRARRCGPSRPPISTSAPDAVRVDRHERIARRGSRASTYSGRNLPASSREKPKRHLREVVGAEREELGLLGDLVRGHRARAAPRSSCRPGTRRPTPPFAITSSATRRTIAAWSLELLDVADQRDHDLGHRPAMPFFDDSQRRLEDRARLHLGDLGIGDAEPAAAVPEHRVELVQLLDRAAAARACPSWPAIVRYASPSSAALRALSARCPPSAPRASAGTRGAAGRACGS